MPRDRRIDAYCYHRGERGDLVRITAACESRRQHHREPRGGEHHRSDNAQVQSRYNQQMRHAGTRESLPQRISDFALIANHQRAHLGVFRIRKIAIEEFADVRPYRFNLACGEGRTMPDDLKDRRTERLASRSHRRGDAVARHQPHVIKIAGIAVVARKMDARSQPDFVAQLETPAPEHRNSDIAARLRHRRTLLGAAIDSDVNSVPVSFMLGLTIEAALDRDARAVDEGCDTAL